MRQGRQGEPGEAEKVVRRVRHWLGWKLLSTTPEEHVRWLTATMAETCLRAHLKGYQRGYVDGVRDARRQQREREDPADRAIRESREEYAG